MNESNPSKLMPEVHCPNCKKPMRIATLLPMFNAQWDASFRCDDCDRTVAGLVPEPEDGVIAIYRQLWRGREL